MKNHTKLKKAAQREAGQPETIGQEQSPAVKRVRKAVKALAGAVPSSVLETLNGEEAQKRLQEEWGKKPMATVGVDVGDLKSNLCMLDRGGNEVGEFEVASTWGAFEMFFTGLPAGSRIVMEVGTHSPWMSRLLKGMKEKRFDVIVANARKLPKQRIKTDRRDAQMLARKGYEESSELGKINHRGEQQQKDLLVVRIRAGLVGIRTEAINMARGMVKGFGERLDTIEPEKVTAALADTLPEELREVIQITLRVVESLNAEIAKLDEKIEETLCRYPVTKEMMKIRSVGPVTALTFVLTIGDQERFSSSRTVGVALGMTPGKSQSGESDPELGISKAGDGYMRSLLVQCAQLTLSKRGGDSDIRRWGMGLMGSGTTRKNKKRAVVAVARKLAVLLHKLWSSGAAYDPFYNSKQEAEKAARQAGTATVQ